MYRTIEATLWIDGKVAPLSSLARYLFVYLITSPHSHLSGLYYLSDAAILRETRIPARNLPAAWRELEGAGLALRDGEREVVFVRRMLRYQGKGPRVMTSCARQVETLADSPLSKEFVETYPDVKKLLKYTLSDRVSDRVCPPGAGAGAGNRIELPEDRELLVRVRARTPSRTVGFDPAADPALYPWPSVERLVAAYNRLTPDECPAVQAISDGRRKKARDYLARFPDESWWERTFAEIAKSPFLRGLRNGNGHEGFTADLDWLLQKGKDGVENCLKTWEGKYRG